MVQEWKTLREEGWTFQQIAERYNVSRQAVSEALDKAGMKRQTKWSRFYPEWERMYYAEGKSLENIAEISGASYAAVRNYLQKKGLKNQGRRILSERV
jgi:predicted DNA-binding protein YlxM (UPF0122 family)